MFSRHKLSCRWKFRCRPNFRGSRKYTRRRKFSGMQKFWKNSRRKFGSSPFFRCRLIYLHIHTDYRHTKAKTLILCGPNSNLLYFFYYYSSLHIASTPVSFLILCHSANEMSVHTYLKMKYCFDTTRNKQKRYAFVSTSIHWLWYNFGFTIPSFCFMEWISIFSWWILQSFQIHLPLTLRKVIFVRKWDVIGII